MEFRVADGLKLSPRIQNFLEENGIFTYGDLLYWTMKITGRDSVEPALDMPVILPPHIQLYLREQGVFTLRDLLG